MLGSCERFLGCDKDINVFSSAAASAVIPGCRLAKRAILGYSGMIVKTYYETISPFKNINLTLKNIR